MRGVQILQKNRGGNPTRYQVPGIGFIVWPKLAWKERCGLGWAEREPRLELWSRVSAKPLLVSADAGGHRGAWKDGGGHSRVYSCRSHGGAREARMSSGWPPAVEVYQVSMSVIPTSIASRLVGHIFYFQRCKLNQAPPPLVHRPARAMSAFVFL